MPKGTEVAKNEENEENLPQIIGLDASDYEWETVHEEAGTLITMDVIGDTFTAVYTGQDVIEFTQLENGVPVDSSFVQFHFRVYDERYDLNAGHDLLRAFKKIEPNTPVRVQLLKMVDVGKQSPMKSYRVDAARPRETH